MPHAANELLRKSLHIAFGVFAFALKWLPWWAAALVALGAILGNRLVLHRVVGRNVSRHERGYDVGIILYPVSVLLLILVFRHHLHYAAIGWALLAFGDGIATIAGKSLRIGALPWNRDKSWGGFLSFLIFGYAFALAAGYWMGYAHPVVIAIATLAAAIAESLPLGVDDNLTVPFAAAVALIVAGIPVVFPYAVWPDTPLWLGINAALALIGYFARSVTMSGALGGWVLGAILILGAGWPLYVALLVFFILGTATTKLGYARKARLGLAQEKGGRRGFSHAFSNVGVAAICAIAVSRIARTRQSGLTETELIPLFMGIASLATAAADTTASEIGQLFGRRAFLPLTLKRVPVGTEGAISVEGTLAGVVAGFTVAAAGVLATSHLFEHVLHFSWRLVGLLTLCAFAGSYLESIAGSWNRRHDSRVPNGVLNFFNTAAGAILFYALSSL
ncbi:MAG TPA: DUF92 domain-containing protein [Thermoanaerobaculia bacterium]|nr:DUF92 domain-containing protein [Thermoanaerobaculia bacterium]